MYKVLSSKEWSNGEMKIIPIRFSDKFMIMKWRNEQIYHLRQKEAITMDQQIKYFENVVKPQLVHSNPDQILFSCLVNDEFIGYGGLVHINWDDRNSEISFLMNTNLEKEYFKEYWKMYLGLIEIVAFNDLKLNKIYTYAFDLRPKLYEVLEECNFKKEAELIGHCKIGENFKSVIIHSKWNQN